MIQMRLIIKGSGYGLEIITLEICLKGVKQTLKLLLRIVHQCSAPLKQGLYAFKWLGPVRATIQPAPVVC